METIKQFINTLKHKINTAIDAGDVNKANEYAANIMLCSIIILMLAIANLCLILNELGIFTADVHIMRRTFMLMDIVEVPIIIYCRATHGEPKHMRDLLLWGTLAICMMLSTTLGHNVTLVMAIPVVLSLRYCDVNLTRNTVIATIILFGISCVGNVFAGIPNLNIVSLEPGTQLTVETTLREAILEQIVSKKDLIVSALVNDYVPRLMIFSVIGFSCTRIARRAKEMVELQHQVSQKTSRLETELNLATEIQAGMLPCIFPAFPDHDEVDLFAINYPAKEVGGDFYDYFKIDDDHIAIVMADVSGKGVGAALFMTISKIVLKNQLLVNKSVAKALENANRQLCENNEAQLFVTAWAGVYELSSRKLIYADAGHNAPIVHRQGKDCYYLKGKKGRVLAILEDTEYVDNEVQLQNGDEIFLYTDGVTECNDKNQKLYGEERLLALINEEINKPVQQQIQDVIIDLQNYMQGTDQFDDITMLAMRIKE